MPVDKLIAGVPELSAVASVRGEQVFQIASESFTNANLLTLGKRVAALARQGDVDGIVITHGTDTLEETAYVLQRVLQPRKPVVITCAMRPANAPDSDGPANLRDAFVVAQSQDVHGVLVVCAGDVHAAQEVQKIHSHALNPFVSGVAGPVGVVRAGQFERVRSTPETVHTLSAPSAAEFVAVTHWPRVEWVVNHAGADGRLVRALMAADAPDGWIVAGTGNGTLHHDLEAALLDAQKQGAQVLRASRCAQGGVQSREADVLPHTGGLTAVQARVALLMHLVAQQT